MSTVSKYRVLKRFARAGDVVQIKTSGNLYDVVAVDKTPGRITYEVTAFYDAALVNGFRASEVDVIAKRDADELREERAAAQSQDAVEYVAQMSQRRRSPSGIPTDEQRAAVIKRERELDLIDATPAYIVEQAAQSFRENKLHDRRCLASALISAIENMRDAIDDDHDFRIEAQNNVMLFAADENLLSSTPTCLCDDAAARHAYVVRACEDFAAEQSSR